MENNNNTNKKCFKSVIIDIIDRNEPIELIFCFASMVLVVFLTVLAFGTLSSNGRIEYCYIDYSGQGVHKLIGYRAWRLNAEIAISEDEQKLIAMGKELGCFTKADGR